MLEPKQHDLAEAEVHAWRGRCLQRFARAEQVVAAALESAREVEDTIKFGHLGGQRLAALKAASDSPTATPKQKLALAKALEKWSEIEAHRAFFAHGVATVLLDKHSNWQVQLDFTDYRLKAVTPRRWNLSKREADAFEARLKDGFDRLSAQVGHFRTRLKA